LFTYYNSKKTDERKAQIDRINDQVRVRIGSAGWLIPAGSLLGGGMLAAAAAPHRHETAHQPSRAFMADLRS
jgi:hypothetical protein